MLEIERLFASDKTAELGVAVCDGAEASSGTGRSLDAMCFHSVMSPELVGIAQYSLPCGFVPSDPPIA